MRMVDFFYAAERERQLQDESERRRRLVDGVRGGVARGRLRRLVDGLRSMFAEAGDALAAFLDRPVVGQHHV